jgi:hypothetical protein
VTDFIAHLQDALTPSYTVSRELTGGGMSRVFVCTDVNLGRNVVVKVLPPELAAGVNHERFRREIQVAAQLQHPHIVPLLSAGEKGALIWYTMPFITGHSLREALARGDKFAVRDVVRILKEVAEALEYAHGLGVIHRDIKPGNVLMQGTHALVTDFGVSKAISASMPQSGYTSAGMAIGTPAYMAPEQIAADPAADHRMDLYALGLLAYELLTGKVPFKEASPQQTMAAQLTRVPEPVEKSRSDVPVALRTLIAKLLEKAPSDRPSSAAEVVDVLDAIQSGSGESAALRALTPSSTGRVVAIAAAAVLMVGAAWMAGQRRGEEVVTTQFRDSLAVAESLQALAPASTMLTRDDSVAIAAAVSRRMAQRPATVASSPARDSAIFIAMADSIRRVVQSSVLDSLMRGIGVTQIAASQATAQSIEAERRAQLASRTGPMPSRGPRRVVVAPPRPSRSRPDLNEAGLRIADSLAAAFDEHPRYVSVPRDSVIGALQRSRTINAVQEALNADIIVSISLIPMPNDSLQRLIQVRDVRMPNGGSAMRLVNTTHANSDAAGGLTQLARESFRAIFDMERQGREMSRVRVAMPAPPAPPITP